MSAWSDAANRSVQHCFPNLNQSCTKAARPEVEYVLVYAYVSATSLLTVFLNLLVIVSISHFRQLHTPTNALILSLAVADLLAGLVLMPVQGMSLVEPCWYLGETFCSAFPLLLYVVVVASLGNMVLISADRYVAINDPLRYPLRVTTRRVALLILANWLFSFLYSFYLLYEFLLQPGLNHSCLGECVLTVKLENLVLDAVVCLVAPCCVIVSLYVRICAVARHQASARSERKAARTLGIVVLVYLLFWTPYYVVTLSLGHDQSDSLVINVMYWLLCLNSCVNPLIYAMFYQWFRVSAKCILSLKILQPSSRHFNLFPEHK